MWEHTYTCTVGKTAKLCEFDMVLVRGDTARASTNKKIQAKMDVKNTTIILQFTTVQCKASTYHFKETG